jgi:peptidoglycan/LPS O-acetylase OafA/YrhL
VDTNTDTARLNLASIDILRGVAAAYVFLYHAWGFFLRGLPISSVADLDGSGWYLVVALDTIAKHGWLGVPLFFVLSGFCVHLPQAHSRALDFRSYVARRLIRIWPPYAVAVVLGVVMAFATGSEPVVDIAVNAILHFVFWIWATDPLSTSSHALNGVIWSVVVEVQLYVIYALAWPLLQRFGIWRAATLALVAGAAYHFAVELGVDANDLPNLLAPRDLALSRFGEWLLGAALAEWVVSRPNGLWRKTNAAVPLAGLAVVIALRVVSERYDWREYTPETLFSCAAAMLVIYVVAFEQRSPKFRDSTLVRVGAVAGRRCYSLYLFHYPVLAICGELAARTLLGEGQDKDALAGSWFWGTTTLIAMVAAIVVTELVYRTIELPSHRLARIVGEQIRYRRRLTAQTLPGG